MWPRLHLTAIIPVRGGVSELLAAFEGLVRTDPAKPLIHLPAEQRSVCAREVWAAHLEYGDALRHAGLRRGHLLLLAIGNRAPVVPLFLASRALDLTMVAVDAGTTPTELEDVSQRFGVAAVVSGAAASDATALPDGLCLTARDGRVADYAGGAVLKLTSGSTGLPKAARNSERQLVADSRQIVAGMGIGADDTQMGVIPLSHAYGLSVVLVPLVLQGTPIVLRDAFVPHQFAHDALTTGATTFAGVPFMFDYFLTNPPAEGWPPRLRRLISAGARLSPATVLAFSDRFGVKIHSFYGTSESGGIAYDGSDQADGDGTVGHPLPGVVVTCRADAATPPGTGRVHVRSEGVADGYVDEPSDEFLDGGYLTGDYGMFDDRGRLRLTGRVSSFINVAGKKVQPGEVEDVLRQMPAVRDVRVLGAPDAQRGEQVVACVAVAPEQQAAVTNLAVRRFCSSRLPPHKIPRLVIVLDAIPLTPRGKTDRRALQACIAARIAGFPQ